MLTHQQKILLLWLVAIICISIAMLLPPMAQPLAYHQFADQRSLFLFPNTLDVLSNFLFMVVGIAGLHYLYQHRQQLSARLPIGSYAVFFAGVLLVSVGSTWYHLQPDNIRLVWDRLPMTLAFMSFFSAVIGEILGLRTGQRFLLPLLLAGLASVVYWILTEQQGQGDLRPYILVQFYPVLGVMLMLYLFRSPVFFRRYVFYVIGYYALSKVLEVLDKPIFELSGVVSGHSLKHLAAAMATAMIFFMIRKRHQQWQTDGTSQLS